MTDLFGARRGLLACTFLVAALATTRAQAAPPDQKAVLLLGHSGARDALWSVPLPVTAVFQATRAAGARAPVTTGTVTPAGYKASPTDALVWERPGGKPVTFKVARIVGDLRPGGNFMNSNHQLRYNASARDEMDVTVERERKGRAYSARLKGWVALRGKRHDIDLVLTGKDHFEGSGGDFERSDGGFGSKDDYKLTGRLQCPGLKMTVDETWHWEGIGAGGDSAFADSRTLKNKVVAGGKAYTWDGVLLTKNYRRGKISRADDWHWTCKGRVLLGGRAVATYAKNSGPGGTVIYKLDTADGVVELEKWR